MNGARITLLTKPGCHLCDDARAVVAEVAAATGTAWEERNILNDPELMREWAEYIPVVLVDGEVHDWFRVRPDRLRKALGAR